MIRMLKREFTSKQLVLVFLSTIAMFSSAAVLFYRQATGQYISDISIHIRFALEGEQNYSLLHLCFEFLFLLGQNTVWIVVFLALMAVASVYATWYLLRYLAPLVSGPRLLLLAWLCNFEMSIYIPAAGGIYMGSLSGTVWHNPTYIAFKPLAILAVLFFLYTYKSYLDKFPWRHFLLFTAAFTLTTWIKPNFALSFAPAMAVLLLADLFKTRGKSIGRAVLLGCSVIPSVVLCLVQAFLLFNEDSKVAFGFLELFGIYAQYPLLNIAKSLLFPLLALLYWRQVNGPGAVPVVVTNAVLAYAQLLLLFEEGDRKTDGNFLWGAYFATFLLFVVGAAALSQWQEKNRNSATGKQKAMAYFIWAILGIHAATGLIYYISFIVNGSYMI